MTEFTSFAKRSCIVITCFAVDQPGFLDFAYRIRALAKHYRVTLVSNAPLTQAELQIKGAEYVVLPGREGRRGWLCYLWNCARLIRSRHPDCAVLLHSAAAPITLLVGRIPTALYWNEHPSHFAPARAGISLAKRIIRRFVRNLIFFGARKATVVMPIGEAHHADLLAHGCALHQLQLIYMGVDASFVAPHPCMERNKNGAVLDLIYVGTVAKERGRDVMIEAIKIANAESKIARLTIVGASEQELAYCRQYAERLGISEIIQLYGRISGDKIPALLRQADIGLCLWEDQLWWRFNPPTKLFEYLVAGLPVLASNICTHTKYISNWQNGLIFDYDSRNMAEAICALWGKRSELPMFKRRAHESGAQYVWSIIEPHFVKTISSIIYP